MWGDPFSKHARRPFVPALGAALALAVWANVLAPAGRAEEPVRILPALKGPIDPAPPWAAPETSRPSALVPPPPPSQPSPPPPPPAPPADLPVGLADVPVPPWPGADVLQAGCASCTGGGLPPPQLPFLGGEPPCSCGAGGTCIPGRTTKCSPCNAQTCVGRFFCGLYECICCPDPCYESRWLPLANSAFFVDAVRPQTQQRVRWDSAIDFTFPDRNEFFWARADGMGKGPKPIAPFRGVTHLRDNDLSLYTEVATGAAGITVEMPYRMVSPSNEPHASGFADMTLGTKALLFDCELLQLGFEFKTYLPTGDFTKGLGVGHVSLEPSLVLGIKLGPDTYFQGQLSEWIPLGGDPVYQGSLLHYHASINQLLFRILPDVPVIGTTEFNGWSFQAGAYTDPITGGPQRSNGETYVTVGGGLRVFVCEKIDFGIAASFAVTERHFAEQLYRTEFRWRY